MENILAGTENNTLEMEDIFVDAGNSFEEKKAIQYARANGLDYAIDKLAVLSIKSDKARKMLDFLVDCKESAESHMVAPVKSPVSSVPQPGLENPKPIVRRSSTKKVELDDKEKLSRLMSLLKLSYTNVEIDAAFNPVAAIIWKKGRAWVNGMPVEVVDTHLRWMRRNVFGRNYTEFNMRLVNVKNDRVLAIPDIEDFNKRRRDKNQSMKFDADVKFRNQGRGFDIFSSVVGKRVIIPKQHLDSLKLKEGLWQFETISEQENRIIAKPVEYLEKPSVFVASVRHKRYGIEVYCEKCEKIGKQLIVPNRFMDKLAGKFGIWKFIALEEKQDKVIAEPICFLKTEDKSQVAKNPMAKMIGNDLNSQRPQPRSQTLDHSFSNFHDHEIEQRLEKLFSNGRLEL